MADPPSGTVTFLFTDIEGSTRLWEDYPDAMPGAFVRHDAILRDAVESAGGHVVKTTGDGFFARRAEAALGAALAAQRALAAAGWGATGALRVRVGVHTGDAEFREGDYHGPAVNRAARLMTAGHGARCWCRGPPRRWWVGGYPRSVQRIAEDMVGLYGQAGARADQAGRQRRDHRRTAPASGGALIFHGHWGVRTWRTIAGSSRRRRSRRGPP